jgi:transposase-like protein
MLLFNFLKVISSPEECIAFLREKRLLQSAFRCSCTRLMTEQRTAQVADGYQFRCTACKKTSSIRQNSIFAGSNIPLAKILSLIYLTSLEVKQQNIIETLGLSEPTVIVWQDKIRNSYSNQLNNIEEHFGGPGKIVEIDESLVSKSKPARNGVARPVPERWVFGLFDREKKLGTMQFVNNRSVEELLPIVQKFCLPGTTIYSDGWKAYDGLTALGFIHKKVIHEKEFVVHGTDIHTNNVENYWGRCKAKFKRMRGPTSKMLPSYLDEFMWNERFGRSVSERFLNTLQCFSE